MGSGPSFGQTCPFNSLGSPPGSRNSIQGSLAAAGTQPGSEAPAESCSKLNQALCAGLRATNYFKREGQSLALPIPPAASSGFNGSSVESRERPSLSSGWEPSFLSPAHQRAPKRCHYVLAPKAPLSFLWDLGHLKGTAEPFPAPLVSCGCSSLRMREIWGTWAWVEGGSHDATKSWLFSAASLCFGGMVLNPSLGKAGESYPWETDSGKAASATMILPHPSIVPGNATWRMHVDPDPQEI